MARIEMIRKVPSDDGADPVGAPATARIADR
jgi:hypothetical protein